MSKWSKDFFRQKCWNVNYSISWKMRNFHGSFLPLIHLPKCNALMVRILSFHHTNPRRYKICWLEVAPKFSLLKGAFRPTGCWTLQQSAGWNATESNENLGPTPKQMLNRKNGFLIIKIPFILTLTPKPQPPIPIPLLPPTPTPQNDIDFFEQISEILEKKPEWNLEEKSEKSTIRAAGFCKKLERKNSPLSYRRCYAPKNNQNPNFISWGRGIYQKTGGGTYLNHPTF